VFRCYQGSARIRDPFVGKFSIYDDLSFPFPYSDPSLAAALRREAEVVFRLATADPGDSASLVAQSRLLPLTWRVERGLSSEPAFQDYKILTEWTEGVARYTGRRPRTLRTPEIDRLDVLTHELEVVEELALVLRQMSDHAQQLLEQTHLRASPRSRDFSLQQTPLTGGLDVADGEIPIGGQKLKRLTDAVHAGKRPGRRHMILFGRVPDFLSPIAGDEASDCLAAAEARTVHQELSQSHPATPRGGRPR
jgi:hypothetical protein